ncbi:MAG: hypothetical protein AAB469_00050 [Patescibacteria group bacterium]
MPELDLLPERTKKIEIGAATRFGPSFFIFIIVFVLYGGLFFYNKTLESKVQELDASLISFNQNRDKAKEERIAEVNSKLNQAQILLGRHMLWSKGFKKIQQLTLPSVQFESLVASLPELKFEFKATAPNLTAIAKQGANFLADESVSDISVNQIKILTNGRTEFIFKLTFNSDKFLK